MPHDVIIVTVNYRLGPLGFLTLGIEDAPGNQAMLDQRLSMIWVQENIANFGGDPNQVTIAGESAGSFSVFYHMISPGSQVSCKINKKKEIKVKVKFRDCSRE